VMLFLSLLAMGVIWRWEDAPRAGTLLLAAGLTALAILAKAPAAFLGIVLAAAVWRRWGAASLRRPEVWAAAVLALAPPLGWYVWAYRFWKVYGLSLGLSNETHLIGLDMLRPPRFLVGIAKWETLGVFTPAGWLLVAAALAWPGAWRRRLLVWYGAVLLFYVVSARTSGDDWSFYYHALSIAPGCLLMGAGLAALLEGRGIGPPAWQRGVAVLAAIGTLAGLAAAGAYLIHRRDSNADYLAMRTCDLEFARQVPPTGLIVVDGGTMFDEYGTPVAHNESMAFAWMDRKGFNYGTEELAVDTLDAIAARGGQYWIARDRELGRQDLRQQVDARYRRLASCGTFTLYDLQTRPDRAAE
jgi:hypothetical protein